MHSLCPLLLAVSTTVLLAPNARSQTELLRITGDAAGDHLGFSVSHMGDVDNDGFPDLVVSAPNGGTMGEGIVKVISVQHGTTIRSWSGLAPGDRYGFAVAHAGDFEGDGVDDVVVGAPLADFAAMDAGMIRVLSGSSGAILRQWGGSLAGFQLGFAVDGGSDVSADGFDDVIAGEPKASFSGVDSGRARVHRYQQNAPWAAWNGSTAGERAGHSVAFVGDMNGDGKHDFVVGAPGALGIAGTPSANSAGAVYVHSGGSGLVYHTLIAPGTTGAPGVVGWSVATAGDVSGDGTNDLLTGGLATNFGPCGGGATGPCGTSVNSAWIVSYGGSGPSIIRWHFGAAASDDLGYSVAPAGDVDGDGRADYLLGSPSASNGTIDTGAVHVFSAASWQPIQTYFGKTAGARCGTTVSEVGDLDGDGRGEVLAGIPNDDDGGTDAGAAVVVRPLPPAVQKEILLGDKLVGSFAPGSVWHEFSFHVVAGTRIKLEVDSKDGLGATVFVTDPNKLPIDSWSLPPWSHADVSATTKVSGKHHVRIQPDFASTGGYSIKTGRKLPTAAKSQKQILKGSGSPSGPLVLPFLATANSTLTFTVQPKKKSPFTPIVTLLDTTGTEVDAVPHDVTGGSGSIGPIDYQLSQTGLYKIVVAGLVTGEEKVKVSLHLDQPKGDDKVITNDG